MASGAALRARVISAFLSVIRYWSSGAMLGYCALASCARPCHAVLSTTTSARLPSVIILTMLRFIDFPLRYERNSCILSPHNTYRYVCWVATQHEYSDEPHH